MVVRCILEAGGVSVAEEREGGGEVVSSEDAGGWEGYVVRVGEIYGGCIWLTYCYDGFGCEMCMCTGGRLDVRCTVREEL